MAEVAGPPGCRKDSRRAGSGNRGGHQRCRTPDRRPSLSAAPAPGNELGLAPGRAARKTALNVFAGHGTRVVGCRNVEGMQHSVVNLMGPASSFMPVHLQNQTVYVGRVESEFIKGYSAGHFEMLMN